MRRSLGLFLVIAFAAIPLFAQTPETVTCPVGLTAGGPTGTYTATLTGPAPAALTATPDSSSTAVVTVPASVTIPAGATTFTFQVTPVSAGNADVGVTVNGSRLDCRVSVAAAAAPVGGPTLGTTGLVIMALLLAVTGVIVLRRL